jgi:hypothetical protein
VPEPLLTIPNRHHASCGSPPSLNLDGLYVGYFAGEFGDQWIFTSDPRTGRAELRGGDIGWDHVCEVKDGSVENLIISLEECRWLDACWTATRAHRRLPRLPPPPGIRRSGPEHDSAESATTGLTQTTDSEP